MELTKKNLYTLLSQGKSSEDFEGTEMGYAMYAYEIYGDATRDNSFATLVFLGKELGNEED